MDNVGKQKRRVRFAIILAFFCICGMAVWGVLRPSCPVEFVGQQSIPALSTIEDKLNIRLPPTAQVEIYEATCFLDEEVIAKIRIPRQEVSSFIANSPFATVPLSTTQRYGTQGNSAPRGWTPDSATHFQSGTVETPEPRRGLMVLLIDLDDPQTAVIYLIWGSA